MSFCVDLEILYARSLPMAHGWLQKPPKPYVQVILPNRTISTPTALVRTDNPVWNHTLTLIILTGICRGLMSINHQISLSFSVKTKSLPFDRCIGTADATLRLSEAPQLIVVNLEVPGRKAVPAGQLAFRVCLKNPLLAGSASIQSANQALQSTPLTSDTISAGSSLFRHADTSTLRSALQSLSEKLSSITNVLNHLSQVHPYIELAWSVTSSLYQVIQGQVDRDQKVTYLVATMTDIYTAVEALNTDPEKVALLEDTLLAVAKQTIECTLFVREYCNQGFQGRMLHQTFVDPSDKIQNFMEAFDNLRTSLNTAINVQTALVSMKMSNNIDRFGHNIMLERLRPADNDLSERDQCLTGTRTEILSFISQWLLTPYNETILWVGGLAGSGKSALAASIASRMAGMSRLGAIHFFNRAASTQQSSLVRNLSYQLGLFDSRLGAAIADGLLSNPRVLALPLPDQFHQLVLMPLRSHDMGTEGPIVVILDALDEFGNDLSVLVTSRPEIDIKLAFTTSTVFKHGLRTDTTSNSQDITHYFRVHCRIIVANNLLLKLADDWPGEENLDALCVRSSGLFAWCAAAMKFIETGQDPRERLATVLGNDVDSVVVSPLHALYELVLQQSGLWFDGTFVKDFQWWMGIALLVWQPLPSEVLDEFKENVQSPVDCKLAPALVYSCRSWADHLQAAESERSASPILRHCLGTFFRNHFLFWLEVLSAVNDLQVSMPAVIVAERYLKAHGDQDLAFFAADGLRFIRTFFEPMSESAPHIYISALPFCPTRSPLRAQYHEQFPNTFSVSQGEQTTWPPILNVIQTHHAAVGAIVAMPNGKQVASASADQTVLISDLATGAAVCHPLRGHHGAVWALDVSRDGLRLVSGSSDQHLIMWDCVNARQILPPFGDHSGAIWSVKFSSDSQSIASGSDDRTIRIWNSHTAESMCPPFVGHSGTVWSVDFSEDDTRVVSGSADKTVRVWTKQGAPILVLNGHKADVWCVTWSLDGRWILSGSGDQNIRLWDALDGSLVLGPLLGHTGAIWAVCFSTDGRSFITGSAVKSLRIWDTATGESIRGPFTGHDGGIWSVTFSNDGSRIFSGSADGSIRIWDTESASTLFDPVFDSEVWSVAFLDGDRLSSGSSDKHVREWDVKTGKLLSCTLNNNWTGHFTPVHSSTISGTEVDQPWVVALSHDGRCKAVGSRDGLINVWSQETGCLLYPPIQAHHGIIWSLAFSADGQYMASASADRTVSVWETDTGVAVGHPLRGHTGDVWSVDFSSQGSLLASGSVDRTIRIWDMEKLNDIEMWSEQSGGWIRGPNRELLLWVPPYYREGLLWPRTELGIGKHITKLDLTNFVDGIDWPRVRRPTAFVGLQPVNWPKKPILASAQIGNHMDRGMSIWSLLLSVNNGSGPTATPAERFYQISTKVQLKKVLNHIPLEIPEPSHCPTLQRGLQYARRGADVLEGPCRRDGSTTPRVKAAEREGRGWKSESNLLAAGDSQPPARVIRNQKREIAVQNIYIKGESGLKFRTAGGGEWGSGKGLKNFIVSSTQTLSGAQRMLGKGIWPVSKEDFGVSRTEAIKAYHAPFCFFRASMVAQEWFEISIVKIYRVTQQQN
ncbi:WD40-repeat-containing domain protein [Favolaschia claudopus]|uniref:WD40-repeat-containing domain protein n=1 Tax=Favolaschia claudopus TaxID=2862362 RepID=A0AAW0AU61_9AGAR